MPLLRTMQSRKGPTVRMAVGFLSLPELEAHPHSSWLTESLDTQEAAITLYLNKGSLGTSCSLTYVCGAGYERAWPNIQFCSLLQAHRSTQASLCPPMPGIPETGKSCLPP